MAKITITLDTETKALTANIDGVDYPDVQEVCMYKDDYDGESKCNFSIYLKPVKNNGVKNRTYFSSAMVKERLIKQVKNGVYLLNETKELAKHWLFQTDKN